MAQLLLGGLIGYMAALVMGTMYYSQRYRRAAASGDTQPAEFVAAVKYELDRELAKQATDLCSFSYTTLDPECIPETCPGCGRYVDVIQVVSGEWVIEDHRNLWNEDAR